MLSIQWYQSMGLTSYQRNDKSVGKKCNNEINHIFATRLLLLLQIIIGSFQYQLATGLLLRVSPHPIKHLWLKPETKLMKS